MHYATSLAYLAAQQQAGGGAGFGFGGVPPRSYPAPAGGAGAGIGLQPPHALGAANGPPLLAAAALAGPDAAADAPAEAAEG